MGNAQMWIIKNPTSIQLSRNATEQDWAISRLHYIHQQPTQLAAVQFCSQHRNVEPDLRVSADIKSTRNSSNYSCSDQRNVTLLVTKSHRFGCGSWLSCDSDENDTQRTKNKNCWDYRNWHPLQVIDSSNGGLSSIRNLQDKWDRLQYLHCWNVVMKCCLR